MEIRYSNNKLKKYFTNLNELKRIIDNNWAKKIKYYLDSLYAANDFEIFLSTCLDHPEQLKGLNNAWTLRINANARLLFELENKEPKLSKYIIIKGVYDNHEGKYNWYIK